MRVGRLVHAALITAVCCALLAPGGAAAEPRHGVAMHGEPALPPDFAHLGYANPEAPKGGRITYGVIGSFDSLNPFIVKGTAPRALWDNSWGNNVWEALLVRNRDEPFSLYGLLAESVDMPADRSSVTFRLRPQARWSDGTPVTSADVLFSLDLLRTKGRPNYRSWYTKVATIEAPDERTVAITFNKESDREIPLLIGLMPILPKHATNPDTFDQTSLAVPVGSGPYRVADVAPGQQVTLARNPDYWGKDLPIKRGVDNYDEIRVEYFRDESAHFEAFKKGLFDVNPDSDPARWAGGYTFPAAMDGRVEKAAFRTGLPKGMNGLVFNTRRPVFADPRVREALAAFLDFEWMNRNLFFDAYRRTGSYFQGSELSALGQPATDAERALLAPFPDAVRPEVMDGSYAPKVSDGSGRDRKNIREAVGALKAAGYAPQGGRMVATATGQPLAFEILVQTKDQERIALAFQRALAAAGIGADVRLVDSSQYQERLKGYDFDMVPFVYPASLSPGNEQNFRWQSAAADTPGTFNVAGVKSPAVDATIAAMLSTDTREGFVAAVRALDRALISGSYVVPLFHSPEERIAVWTRIGRPERGSLYGAEPTTWWSKP